MMTDMAYSRKELSISSLSAIGWIEPPVGVSSVVSVIGVDHFSFVVRFVLPFQLGSDPN